MQFTVLIEFLVPGLATTLLLLFILLGGTAPRLPEGLPETASALLLLVVSYPVGILTNFPLFSLQRLVISRKVRRQIFEKYAEIGVDLVALVNTRFGIRVKDLPADHDEKLEGTFHLMSAFVFSRNIERLHTNHIYHEGLQRLSRGILLPLLLACYVVWKSQTPSWGLLVGACVFLALSACFLVRHSVTVEYRQIARYFLVLTNNQEAATASAGRAALTEIVRSESDSMIEE
jgi:hypothetical protein